MKDTGGFTVVMAAVYYEQLRKLLPRARTRIVISAMVVRSGPLTGRILHDLIAAAKRGVHVSVVVDHFAQHPASRGRALGIREFRRQCKETRELLGLLHANGAHVNWVGNIGLNPYAGRYHAKITVIDNDVFTFGGVNMCDEALANIDYMLHARSQPMADVLADLVAENARSLPKQDVAYGLSSQHTILFDAGHPRSSLIYNRACQLTAISRRVVYVSQMRPTGKLAQALKSTNHTSYFNQPTATGWRPDTVAQLVDARNGIVNSNASNRYIHAKCMLFELHDGTNAVLSGSHNFSWRGALFGTKEIALQSTDPLLWKRMQEVVFAIEAAQ